MGKLNPEATLMAATGELRQRTKATESEPSRQQRRGSVDDDSEDANEAPQEEVDPTNSAMAFAKPDETKADDKFAKMIRRSKLAVFMMVSFGLILWAGHMAIVMFVILLQTMLFYEVTDLTYKKRMEEKIPLFRSLHWIGYAISMFFTYGKSMMIYFDNFIGWMIPYHLYLVFCAYVPFFLAFVFCCASSQSAKDKESRSKLLKYMFARLSWLLLIIFVIVFQCRFVMYNVLEGIFWFLLPTSLVIMNDTAAYFTGFCFGKRFIKRPLTVLSPNKTWEGFLGGMIFTLIFAYLFSGFLSSYQLLICPRRHYLDDYVSCKPNPVFLSQTFVVPTEVVTGFSFVGLSIPTRFDALPVQMHSVLLGFFASIFAPFGGFFASAMKRAYNVKDFGSLIPGHGGVMDRMDCQLIMLFCTHIHYRTFIRLADVTLKTVWTNLQKLSLDDQLEIQRRLGAHLEGPH